MADLILWYYAILPCCVKGTDNLFCRYSHANAPMQKELEAREVGNVAAFVLSPLASAVTGSVIYVDNGLNAMGLAMDSQSLVQAEEPAAA